MHEYSKRIAEHIKSCYGDLSSMKLEELCELEKWSKVIKNLTEYDVNKRAIEAMDEAKEEEKLMDKLDGGRMGYRGRDSMGRFVHRSGRGRSAGYTPYLHMMENMHDDDYMDEMPEMRNYRMGYSGGRNVNYGGDRESGYNDGYGHAKDGYREGSRYGRSYDEYRQAKRHYTESKNPEEQKKMKQHIDEIFDDMSDMTSEIARDMTQEEKQRYKQKLQMIMQKI